MCLRTHDYVSIERDCAQETRIELHAADKVTITCACWWRTH